MLPLGLAVNRLSVVTVRLQGLEDTLFPDKEGHAGDMVTEPEQEPQMADATLQWHTAARAPAGLLVHVSKS